MYYGYGNCCSGYRYGYPYGGWYGGYGGGNFTIVLVLFILLVIAFRTGFIV